MESLTETVRLELHTTCMQLPGHKTIIVPSLIPSVKLVVVFVGWFFVVVVSSQINSDHAHTLSRYFKTQVILEIPIHELLLMTPSSTGV